MNFCATEIPVAFCVFGVATLCRSSQLKKIGYRGMLIDSIGFGKKSDDQMKVRTHAIRDRKHRKKDLDRSVDRAVEWQFSFCWQQNRYRGWGSWLRDAGRGS